MTNGRPTNLEPDLLELLGIYNESSVEDEGRLVHIRINLRPVDIAELFPFGSDNDSFGVPACL